MIAVVMGTVRRRNVVEVMRGGRAAGEGETRRDASGCRLEEGVAGDFKVPEEA
jgi:hypothetical protein